MAEHRKNAKTGTSLTQEENGVDPKVGRKDSVPKQVHISREDDKRIKHLLVDLEESFQAFAHRAISAELRRMNLPELEPSTSDRPSGRKGRRREG